MLTCEAQYNELFVIAMENAYKMINELSSFGLTEIQAIVYYNLLRLGKTSSTRLAKEIGVHRSEIYRVLRQLKEKGIVSEEKRRPLQFNPIPPKDAIKILLDEQSNKVEYLRDMAPKLIEWLNSQALIGTDKPSILVIDDDEDISKTLSHLLEIKGFKVSTSKSGGHALGRARLDQYDVALIDIRLPDIEGTKLLKKLRHKAPKIVEIIITGYPTIKNAIEAVNEGADGYLLKPFDPDDLVAIIREKLH